MSSSADSTAASLLDETPDHIAVLIDQLPAAEPTSPGADKQAAR